MSSVEGIMRVYQSSSFSRTIKKLEKHQKLELDAEIKKIIQDPSIGSEKKGDLRGIFVHELKIKNTLFLLWYRMLGEDLELIMIGPHENYYRDLKSYLEGQRRARISRQFASMSQRDSLPLQSLTHFER